MQDTSVVTFGDLKCRFYPTTQEESDATKSLSGSETGSVSMISEDDEEVMQVKTNNGFNQAMFTMSLV